MTNDFKRLAGQLAMEINFDENAVVMATRISDRANKKATSNVYLNGQAEHIRALIVEIIKEYLANFDDKEASFEFGALMMSFMLGYKKDSEEQSNERMESQKE